MNPTRPKIPAPGPAPRTLRLTVAQNGHTTLTLDGQPCPIFWNKGAHGSRWVDFTFHGPTNLVERNGTTHQRVVVVVVDEAPDAEAV